MKNPLLERVVERAATLETHLHHIADRQQRLRTGMRRKITACHQFHGNVARIRLDHGFKNADDVRMTQLARKRGLIEKLRAVLSAELRIKEQGGVNRLERDFAAGKRVGRKVNGSGRAFTEQPLHFVFADPQLQARINRIFRHHFPPRLV